MKREWIVGLLALGAMNVAMAQTLPPAPNQGEQRGRNDGPPSREDGPGGRPRPGDAGSAGGERPDGPPGRMGEGRPGGPGGPDGRPFFGPRNNPTEAMRQYLELVDKYATLAKDPSAAGVSAVVTLTELAKQQGGTAAIDRLTKLLGESKDAAVIRAIRLQLIDLYRSAGQTDKAIEQAEILIRG